jgi:hypothetical protein
MGRIGHPATGAANTDLLTAAAGSTDVVVVLAALAEPTLETVVAGPAPGFAAIVVVVVDDPVPATLVVEDAPGATEVPVIDDAVPATLVDEAVAPAVVESLLATLVGADESLATAVLDTATSDDGTAADELGAGAVDDDGAGAAADDGAWVSAAGAGVSAARAGAAAMVAVATREEMVRMVLRDMSSMIGVLSTEVR